MKKILVACLVLVLASSAWALDRSVTLRWTPPGYYSAGGDCESTANPIPGDVQTQVVYTIRWTVNGGPEQVAVSSMPTFTIPAVLAGATLNVCVGGSLPGASPECWVSGSFVVPVPGVGSCGNITFEVH